MIRYDTRINSKCYLGTYNPNNPTYSHFTQMVWKATTQLGCAVTTCAPGRMTIFPASEGVRPKSFALIVGRANGPIFSRQHMSSVNTIPLAMSSGSLRMSSFCM